MRKILLFLLSLAACAASADVLLVENFEYDDFVTPLVKQSDWTNDYFSSGSFSNAVITNGLSFDGYDGCGIGNAMLLDGPTGSYHPKREFPKVTEGNVYVAFMLRAASCYKNGFVFALMQSLSQTDYLMNGRILFDVDEYYDAYFGFQYGKATDKHISDKIADPQKVYLVVVEYKIIEGKNNDEISLYVFDEMPDSQPEQPLIGPLKDSSIDDLNPSVLLCRGLTDAWLIFDGFRVATTWDEAVAAGTCPTEEALENLTALTADEVEVFSLLGSGLGVYKTTDINTLPAGLYILRDNNNRTRKITIAN